MWRMFSVGVRAPYKANVSDNPWPDVVPGVFVGVIKTKKYFPIFHSQHKALPARLGSSIWTPSVAL